MKNPKISRKSVNGAVLVLRIMVGMAARTADLASSNTSVRHDGIKTMDGYVTCTESVVHVYLNKPYER